MEYELCVLKKVDYYEHCGECNGKRGHVCYLTKEGLKQHLVDFHEIFLNKLEQDGSGELEESLKGIV